MSKLNVDPSLKAKTNVSQDKIDIEDITNNESNFVVDVSDKKEIPWVVEAQVFEYTNDYTKVINAKKENIFWNKILCYIHN